MDPQLIYREFGRRLSALRKEKGLSQAELAARLDMPQSTYASYETGKRKITLELIVLFSRFYGVSPTFLVTGEETVGGQTVAQEDIQWIKKYRALAERGRQAVDMILESRCEAVVLMLGARSADEA